MGNNSVPKFIFRLSRFPVYRGSVLGRFYCTRKSGCWNPKSNTLEPGRPQHVRPAACVMDQEYLPPPSSIATSFPRRIFEFLKMLLFQLFTFLWNFVILMLRNLKFRKLGSVYSWDLKPTVIEGLQETSQPYSAPWVAFYCVPGNCGLKFGGLVATNYFRGTHETEYGRLCKNWPCNSQKLLTGGRISVWLCSNHSWPSH